jgi:signal transduction histidine kinase
MHSGIVFICDHNGIVQQVHRDDFDIFSTPSVKEHLSKYISTSSKEAATHFFFLLSSDGLSSSGPIEFIINGLSRPLFCTGMRLRDRYIIFGAADLFTLGALIPEILYSDGVPLNLSTVWRFDPTPAGRTLQDYQIYEDITRLNNELVNMSRELADAQVEIEMEADELNKEIQVRRQAEEALLLANKKLNLLSSITRHDINNQLTGLMGYLALLQKKQPDPSFNNYFLKINASAQRISSMIQFTKTYENIGIKAPVWQDVRTLVDVAAKDVVFGNLLLKNNLPAGTEILADPLVVKVCYNLMDNAVRYGGKITTIRFSVQKSGDNHLIVCDDDGVGVLVEEKEKIFDRGFGKNTGLGLFLSREILSITGITITETGEPGKGARFEILVPKDGYRFLKESE